MMVQEPGLKKGLPCGTGKPSKVMGVPWQEHTLAASSASSSMRRPCWGLGLSPIWPLLCCFCREDRQLDWGVQTHYRWYVDQEVLLNRNGKPIVCHPHVQRDNRGHFGQNISYTPPNPSLSPIDSQSKLSLPFGGVLFSFAFVAMMAGQKDGLLMRSASLCGGWGVCLIDGILSLIPSEKGTSWRLCRFKHPVMRSPVSKRSSVHWPQLPLLITCILYPTYAKL